MKRTIWIYFLLFDIGFSFAQDTNYVRQCLKVLCSEKCFGRGYVKNGLQNASKFIVSELKQQNVTPLFNTSYTQRFSHTVNTFPGKCEIKLNGKFLVPGVDFILNPSCGSGKGICTLKKVDSAHFIGSIGTYTVQVSLLKKLTFSVSNEQAKNTILIELDKSRLKETPQQLEWKIESKLNPNFESENIGGIIKGKTLPDSFIVFTAHYDHLGGMGKKTFFPGANDNGAGVSGLLDLIKYYKQHSPKYSILFIFFAGEEAGLLGSRYLTETAPIDMKRIKFLFNLDLIGTGEEGITVVNATEFKSEFEKLKVINERDKLLKFIKPRGKAANSDHYWFSEKGVHCFFIYTMGGISAYHDVFDVEKTLPLTEYLDVFHLLTEFVKDI
jgi:aminopeptidase YwaD